MRKTRDKKNKKKRTVILSLFYENIDEGIKKYVTL